MAEPRHAVIVLAAGASRRLGTAKALLWHEGETLLGRTLRLAAGTAPRDIVVVRGAPASAAAVTALAAAAGARSIDCPAWEQGMGASLAAGLGALPAAIDGALVLLCDQPALDADHLAALLERWRAAPTRAVASTYAGIRGAPALLPRTAFAALAGLAADHGARHWLRGDAEVAEVANPALAADLDHPADLAPTVIEMPPRSE